MQELVGTGVALVTPFNDDKSVDYDALERLVNFQIKEGVDYLVVLGTTGEPATLTLDEQEKVKSKIIEVNAGRLPLVLGVGGNNTMAIVSTLQKIDLSNYMAILSVSPYYNKPTQEGIYQHFKAISEVSPLPIIVYNVPGRTGQNMEPSTVLRLANSFKNIVAIKEAAGDLEQAKEIITNKPEEFLVISGDDMIALPMTLAGGAGVISVIGQGLPKDFSKLIRLGLKGESKAANEIQQKLEKSIDLIFEEGNPAGIKTLLKNFDICNDVVRLPLVKATAELQLKIQDFIKAY
ncbi:4-hydroxy-tetrahydrodipicolinate synthase [Urechidicola vernalis]|uniref:4-hydroxy-tetrahydrodipicolinate synthase n=1 Tax=Urechidicola vernalis TaxID=3075600 RepID=A0ABU2YA67_9FLAO|nr:4-hydroxy-tetrahydrodipicolinate synthase [Urechidicola sp. P050]MDT0553963.1 4-hydroxy-tetrahydrodipicolinate synthase [Urechidicola sp. P050]